MSQQHLSNSVGDGNRTKHGFGRTAPIYVEVSENSRFVQLGELRKRLWYKMYPFAHPPSEKSCFPQGELLEVTKEIQKGASLKRLAVNGKGLKGSAS